MSLSKGQNLSNILILGLTYQPFELKIQLKDGFFEVKHDSHTTSEQLETNLQKSKERFFSSQNDQITGNNFGKSVDFWFYFEQKSLILRQKFRNRF